jgi:hypothetical protein
MPCAAEEGKVKSKSFVTPEQSLSARITNGRLAGPFSSPGPAKGGWVNLKECLREDRLFRA